MHQSDKLAEFGAGARDTIPMMVGAAPFGVIFGTLAATGPLHAWTVQFMSLAVFAGSAQFIALGLIAGHAGFTVIWTTTLIVNLRHALYSATLQTALRFVPVTVLTAIIVPMVIAPHGGGAELTWRNAYLIAALVALGVCVVTRKPLVTIVLALTVFFF